MVELIESPKNEVLIKCAVLSNEENLELETFLSSQPGVLEVRRRMHATDNALDQNTLGILVNTWDIVVMLANSVKEAVPYVVPLLTLYLAARKNRKKEEKEQQLEKRDDSELIALADQYGQTVRVVKRPKGTTAL